MEKRSEVTALALAVAAGEQIPAVALARGASMARMWDMEKEAAILGRAAAQHPDTRVRVFFDSHGAPHVPCGFDADGAAPFGPTGCSHRVGWQVAIHQSKVPPHRIGWVETPAGDCWDAVLVGTDGE